MYKLYTKMDYNLEFEYKYARDNLDDESTQYDWDAFHIIKEEYLNMLHRLKN
jgi:hypothetical protein